MEPKEELPPPVLQLPEVLITLHQVVPNQPACIPRPAEQPNDASSSHWELSECRFRERIDACWLECTWVRQTQQPIQIAAAMELVEQEPPPAATQSVELEVLLHQQAKQLETAESAPVAAPPSLPHYAHSRLPAAALANYARARGAPEVPPAPPSVAPGYQAPQAVAGVPGLPPTAGGLVAEATVKPCSAPIPPMPTPGGTAPLLRVGAAQATVAVSAPPGRDPSGTTEPIANEVSLPRAAVAEPVFAHVVQPTSATQPASAQAIHSPARNVNPPLVPPTVPIGVRLYRPVPVTPAAAVAPAPSSGS